MVRIVRTLAAAGAAAAGVALARNPHLRHQLRKAGDAGAQRLQRYAGDWQGVRYRLAGRQPDPAVDDATLADRVRSSIGPLLKRLDLPHVHVMSEDHVILLHGEVGSAVEAGTIEAAVQKVSGVAGVESYLHIGLLPSDTRPSTGRAEPSEQRRRLVAAARDAGVGPDHADEVARAVLSAFADVVPAGERSHLTAHLSPDVRPLVTPPRRHGARGRARTVGELVDLVGEQVDGVTGETALLAARAVLKELRSMVPEERADVSAVLPADLRDLWNGSP
jgi:hypothetical protein